MSQTIFPFRPPPLFPLAFFFLISGTALGYFFTAICDFLLRISCVVFMFFFFFPVFFTKFFLLHTFCSSFVRVIVSGGAPSSSFLTQSPAVSLTLRNRQYIANCLQTSFRGPLEIAPPPFLIAFFYFHRYFPLFCTFTSEHGVESSPRLGFSPPCSGTFEFRLVVAPFFPSLFLFLSSPLFVFFVSFLI